MLRIEKFSTEVGGMASKARRGPTEEEVAAFKAERSRTSQERLERARARYPADSSWVTIAEYRLKIDLIMPDWIWRWELISRDCPQRAAEREACIARVRSSSVERKEKLS